MTQGYIEKGFAIDKTDLEKINHYTRTQFDADSLYAFNVVLCDNDIDRDWEKFSVEALYQLKVTFLGKTGICDHSMKACDQKARVYDTWVEKSADKKTADGEVLHQLKAKAYMVKTQENMPLITEIEAGIKKEVSISCSMGKNICSVCQKDKRSGLCEHFNGKSYNGENAYSVLSDVRDVYEFSFVAVPAQRGAGVTKAYKMKNGDNNMTNVMDTLKSCDESIVLSKSQAKDIVKHISALEEEANLGREYKTNLISEVVGLCSKAMPQMDLNVFGGVAQVMTAKELLCFKKAFLKSEASNQVQLQLKPETTAKSNNNQFKL